MVVFYEQLKVRSSELSVQPFTRLFFIASIFSNFPFPGSPDLDPEPAALLCLRDVQGEQLQVRRRQEAHHPTVLDYYTANICNFQLVQGVSYFLDLMAINTDYSH